RPAPRWCSTARRCPASSRGARARFRPLDAGPVRNAAVLANMAALWIQLALAGAQAAAPRATLLISIRCLKEQVVVGPRGQDGRSPGRFERRSAAREPLRAAPGWSHAAPVR